MEILTPTASAAAFGHRKNASIFLRHSFCTLLDQNIYMSLCKKKYIIGNGFKVSVFASKVSAKSNDKDDKLTAYGNPEQSVYNVIVENEGCKVAFISQKTRFSQSFVKENCLCLFVPVK